MKRLLPPFSSRRAPTKPSNLLLNNKPTFFQTHHSIHLLPLVLASVHFYSTKNTPPPPQPQPQPVATDDKGFTNAGIIEKPRNSSSSSLIPSSEITPSFLSSYCKRRGLIFPNSSIYGGLQGQFDFGPIGTQIKKNIKDLWWRDFVESRLDMLSVDTSVIMHPQVWQESGHLNCFTDKAIRCNVCQAMFRLDHLLKDKLHLDADNLTPEQMKQKLDDYGQCTCDKKVPSKWSELLDFNLLFETNFGPIASLGDKVSSAANGGNANSEKAHRFFLRPETAQGIITNFENVIKTTRKKLPLGVAQVGKAFRNEIAPRDFVFRTREFEQMEIEYFCHPNDSEQWYKKWIEFCHAWCLSHGLRRDHVRLVEHSPESLSHYSVACTDIEYHYGSFWGEMWGIANRTDFDLKAHLPHTKKGKGFYYVDVDRKNERYLPHIVEPSVGVERLFMAFLHSAYREEVVDAEKNTIRAVLQLHPLLAPYKVAFCSLVKKDEILDKTFELYEDIGQFFCCDIDTSGKIGAAYRRQDEIGTPLCVTVDFETFEDHCVTIRERDSMEQVRVPVKHVREIVQTVFGRCRFRGNMRRAHEGQPILDNSNVWMHPDNDTDG
eukprot:CAMPEP_0117440530 /NCGR_PEP_ID=MMETSP0759-20121206/3145_1 /TAXON_ID=63605 /ORGANISM="Percolomonas cosmopolitus, Strain WS" /LENGTH=603 /DNA_ID=CAMNT_0005232313 /DNA_START=118 /DNA_END=1925 /DNA_ORIENTATION=-